MSQIKITGSLGEIGGTELRTALSLSMITGQSVEICNFRVHARKPGLAKRHLAYIRAAAQICSAKVAGDVFGSQNLSFRPGPVKPGEYSLPVGETGNTQLAFLTLLFPLMMSGDESRLVIEGSTHNSGYPTPEFIAESFLPLLEKMGAAVTFELKQYGFYPGAGKIEATISPAGKLLPLNLPEGGEIKQVEACALLSCQPAFLAGKGMEVVARRLRLDKDCCKTRMAKGCKDKASVFFVKVMRENVTELFSCVCRKETTPEDAANLVADQALEYFTAKVPVGGFLAEHLLLPMALAGEGNFRTLPPSEKVRTAAKTIQLFTGHDFEFASEAGQAWRVSLG